QACLCEWRAAGARAVPVLEDPDQPGDAEPPPWAAALRDGRPFQVATAALEDPLRAVLEGLGTRSLLLVPVVLDGVWWGHLAFHASESENPWSVAEVEVLATAAAMLAGAVQRTRLEAELHRSERRKQAIVDCA